MYGAYKFAYLNVKTQIFFAEVLIESEVKAKLYDLVRKEILNIPSRQDCLKWEPRTKGWLFIPLYRMILLPVVRRHLKIDVYQLASFLVKTGYMKGNEHNIKSALVYNICD